MAVNNGRTTKIVRVPFYWLIVGIMVAVVSPLTSIFASVQIAEGNARQVIAAQQQSQVAAREESRLRTCGTFAALLDVYVETPPQTPAGKGAQAAYLVQYRALGCQPPRTK